MSDRSSRVVWDWTSGLKRPGSRSLGPVRVIGTAAPSSSSNERDSSSSTTYETSTSQSGTSTSSQEASPAKTSRSQGGALECLSALARDSGQRWGDAFAYYDHASSSWKTSQG